MATPSHRFLLRLTTLPALALAAPTFGQFNCPDPTWQLPPAFETLNGLVYTILPEGPSTFIVGGDFVSAGGLTVNGIARWDGTAWTGFGTGLTGGSVNPAVQAITTLPNGDLVVGGDFINAGDVSAKFVAQWNGFEWAPIGAGFSTSGSNSFVACLATLSDGSVVAGGLMGVSGSTPIKGLAQWDGSQWKAFGQGISEPFSGVGFAFALVLVPESDGQFIVGGNFKKIDGVTVNGLARWTGASWQTFGSGFNDRVSTLESWSSPSGQSFLYAAGRFSTAGGVSAARVARWNGTSWEPLGAGIPGAPPISVAALKVFTVGENPLAYVGGSFKNAGGVGISSLATWDGTQWSPVGGTVNTGIVYDLALLTDGTRPTALIVGGQLFKAGTLPATNVIALTCDVPSACPPDCDQSGSLDINDFICFQTFFSLGDVSADCDASGAPDIDDFICFQTQFSLGC
jgi:trimeric autotransporter adhesin